MPLNLDTIFISRENVSQAQEQIRRNGSYDHSLKVRFKTPTEWITASKTLSSRPVTQLPLPTQTLSAPVLLVGQGACTDAVTAVSWTRAPVLPRLWRARKRAHKKAVPA